MLEIQITPTECELLLDLAGIKPAPVRQAIADMYTTGASRIEAARRAGINSQNLTKPLTKFVTTKTLADHYARALLAAAVNKI